MRYITGPGRVALGGVCQNADVTPVAGPLTDSLPALPRQERPNLTSIGTIVWLASELMFFAALFAMYFTLRAVNPDVWRAETELLNIPFAAANTTVLVLSSVTAQLGVFAAERGDAARMQRWFIITFLMGAFFIGGQAYEYALLVSEGLTMQSSAFGSAFFLTTGFHALHVTGGLVAFLFVLARAYLAPRFTHSVATSAVVTSYYWHFVDVVWIGLFAVIYLVK